MNGFLLAADLADPRTVVLIALLGAVALAGAGLGFGRKQLPAWLRPLFDTGILFIFAGALVGPFGLGLVQPPMVESLKPVLVAALGWVGFLFGVNFEIKRLKKYPLALHALAFGEGLVTLLTVFAVSYFVLQALGVSGERVLTAEALTLAACAAGTAPAALFLMRVRRTGRLQHLPLLQLVATLDDLPGLIALGTVFAFFNPWFGVDHPAIYGFLALGGMVVLGGVTSFVLDLLSATSRDHRTQAMLILGGICVASGVAYFLRLCPLFTGVVLGMVFANTSDVKEKVYGFLQAREKDIYVVILILAGVLWQPTWFWILALTPAFVLARAAGKVFGFWLCSRPIATPEKDPGALGFSLLPQGGMSLAIAISYSLGFPAGSSMVITLVTFGIIINQGLGAPLALRQLSEGRRA